MSLSGKLISTYYKAKKKLHSRLAEPDEELLSQKARLSGDPFRESVYYELAEKEIDYHWEKIIWPMIKNMDFTCVVDLAAGHGRNSAKLLKVAKRVIIVDINQECIDFCRERFKGEERVTYIKNNGFSLSEIADDTVSLICSFDAMVHFEKDVIRQYMKEFMRVLKPGGCGFCHHSNYDANPGGDFTKNPHWRNYMSRDLFAKYCREAGLNVVQQKVIDWTEPNLDCLTVFQKPN